MPASDHQPDDQQLLKCQNQALKMAGSPPIDKRRIGEQGEQGADQDVRANNPQTRCRWNKFV
jgi:hypothetical protein